MKVSVVIPAHNCAQYIAQTLDCVRFQTIGRDAIEVIVCLDGCTDKTADVVVDYVKQNRDMNIQVVKSNRARGVAVARNTGVAMAQGEYLHFMDADDLINTDFYRVLYESAVAVDADVAVAGFVNERDAWHTLVFDRADVISNPVDKMAATRVTEIGYMGRYLMRREFWTKHKLSFPADLRICEDLVPANKMVYLCNRLITVLGATYVHKDRAASLMNTSMNHDGGADWARAIGALDEFLASVGMTRRGEAVRNAKFRLFGIIPLVTLRHEGPRTRVRLLGIPLGKIESK